jgi:hypothetical protein
METGLVTLIGGILALVLPALLDWNTKRKKQNEIDKRQVPSLPDDLSAVERVELELRDIEKTLPE